MPAKKSRASLSGYFVFPRTFRGTPEYEMLDSVARLLLFVLWENALWHPSEFTSSAGQVTLEAGQLMASESSLARLCGKGISEKQIHRALLNLEYGGFVGGRSGGKKRGYPGIVTVRNYGAYLPNAKTEGGSEGGSPGASRATYEPETDSLITSSYNIQTRLDIESNSKSSLQPHIKPPKPTRTPQAQAFEFWRDEVWPTLSPVPLPAPGGTVFMRLAARIKEVGLDALLAAMATIRDRDGKVWVPPDLDLLAFLSNNLFPRYLPRKEQPLRRSGSDYSL